MPSSGAVLATSLVSCVLYIKYFLCLFAQGASTYKTGERPREDMSEKEKADLTAVQPDPGAPDTEALLSLKDHAKRLKGVVSNDVENLPMALAVFWGACFSVKNSSPRLHIAVVCIFAIARCMHTFLYIYGINSPPWSPRTLSFFCGIICTLAAAINGVVGAVQAAV